MSEQRYEAAQVIATVEVTAFEKHEEVTWGGPRARRTVKLEFSEVFRTDADLDVALDAFTNSVREAARR